MGSLSSSGVIGVLAVGALIFLVLMVVLFLVIRTGVRRAHQDDGRRYSHRPPPPR